MARTMLCQIKHLITILWNNNQMQQYKLLLEQREQHRLNKPQTSKVTVHPRLEDSKQNQASKTTRIRQCWASERRTLKQPGGRFTGVSLVWGIQPGKSSTFWLVSAFQENACFFPVPCAVPQSRSAPSASGFRQQPSRNVTVHSVTVSQISHEDLSWFVKLRWEDTRNLTMTRRSDAIRQRAFTENYQDIFKKLGGIPVVGTANGSCSWTSTATDKYARAFSLRLM